MAFLNQHSTLHGLCHSNLPFQSITRPTNHNFSAYKLLLWLYSNCNTNRRFSTRTESEFSGKNAYELLGVSDSSSFSDIKAVFRKLAKQTHPDLAQSSSDDLPNSSQFVQILAAYEIHFVLIYSEMEESYGFCTIQIVRSIPIPHIRIELNMQILSDFEKRAHYDRYLLSQKTLVQKHSKQRMAMYQYESHGAKRKQMEVVDWLKWYQYAMNDLLSKKKVVVGSSYFEVLESDFYSAIHAAYYGPEIDSMDLLPDCFEAEKSSVYGTPEVLHLVSGQYLFGMMQGQSSDCGTSEGFKNLELHVSGRVVAVATRVPPKSYSKGSQVDGSQDHIHSYLNKHEDPTFPALDSRGGVAIGSRIPLGTITGLGTSAEEEPCFTYNISGIKTHVIMKHRTLLVKHMHWYAVGDGNSVCECRCTRARLPPSKFWLFEPRCGLHDIAGWYVETFGRDKKGRM